LRTSLFPALAAATHVVGVRWSVAARDDGRRRRLGAKFMQVIEYAGRAAALAFLDQTGVRGIVNDDLVELGQETAVAATPAATLRFAFFSLACPHPYPSAA
jgi:hypothetical protein